MKRPQVVVFERDGQLARHLDVLIGNKKWVLRESKQSDACIRLLAGQGPTVFVVRLPAEAEIELKLMTRVAESLPHVSTVAVGDADAPAGMNSLVWDLDVDYALFPPMPISRLPAIVEGLMNQP